MCNVLKRNGIEPAPERSKRTTWSTFLKAHWKVLAASDFFTVEVWTSRGLLTHYVLFVMSLAERVVHVVGITTRPGEAWILQVGRNLIDEESTTSSTKTSSTPSGHDRKSLRHVTPAEVLAGAIRAVGVSIVMPGFKRTRRHAAVRRGYWPERKRFCLEGEQQCTACSCQSW